MHYVSGPLSVGPSGVHELSDGAWTAVQNPLTWSWRDFCVHQRKVNQGADAFAAAQKKAVKQQQDTEFSAKMPFTLKPPTSNL